MIVKSLGGVTKGRQEAQTHAGRLLETPQIVVMGFRAEFLPWATVLSESRL